MQFKRKITKQPLLKLLYLVFCTSKIVITYILPVKMCQCDYVRWNKMLFININNPPMLWIYFDFNALVRYLNTLIQKYVNFYCQGNEEKVDTITSVISDKTMITL